MSDTDKAKVVAGDGDAGNWKLSLHLPAIKLNKEGNQAQVIMTTSTIPSEGKSFVSSNLALTFSSHGERILWWRLKITQRRQISWHKERLRTHPNFRRKKRLRMPFINRRRIWRLADGRKVNQSTQLLNSPAFAQLLNELRQNYDRILIDCPPLAAVSDALNIVSLTDGVIYVIKYNTVVASAALNIERINKSETPILGALMNDVSGTGSGYYYSQYSNDQYGQYA